MRFTRHFRAAIAGLSVIALAACAQPGGPSGAPQTVADRSGSQQRIGDENHPKILAQFGGEVQNARLRNYVNDLGNRLARESEQPNARWTFTVLDSPVVNAFALPGGYIYVTRGLVALADDEAELAGVLGHEIGHVTADHSTGRQQRAGIAQLGILGATILGAVAGLSGDSVQAINQIGNTLGQGYVASYSRTQEFEADQLGVRYIARAGYDPEAQADFLRSMQDEAQLQASIAGGNYNPNRVDFFSTHPATAQRVQEAIRAAGVQNADGPRNRERFLNAIDGMIYGDSAEQGFVDGRTFSHPKLRLTFTVPSGFTIRNSAAQVTAAGPSGSGIIFDGDRYNGGSMDAYISRTWAPAIAQNARVGNLDNLRRGTIDGLPAASATLPAQTRNGTVLLRMTAIRDGSTVYRFLGIQPQNAGSVGRSIDQAAASFRKLSASEARRLTPKRIDVYTVRGGDTVRSLARRMPFDTLAEERFRVLNNLRRGEEVRRGQQVKIVVR